MQDCPAAFLEGKRFAFIKGVPKILAGQFSFRQYGAIRRSDLWGSGFLPSVYQGVQCRTTGDPVLDLTDPEGMDRNLHRRMLDTLAEMHAAEFERSADPETQTRISQYELAYRMQMSVPEVMNISQEPQHILEMYGAQPGDVSPAETADDPRVFYKGHDPTFPNNCLLARRLIEAGVRFVQ